MTEVPELPEWVKTLIEDAYERGIEEGRDEGRRWMLTNIRRKVDELGNYYS